MEQEEKDYLIEQANDPNIENIGQVSDGYHTFDALYHQRLVLFATIVNTRRGLCWKSYKHEDGNLCFGGGWFIVGIDTPDGPYTYHYENKYWDMFYCKELEVAPHWDGHTDKDVMRLTSLYQRNFEIKVEHEPYYDNAEEVRTIYDVVRRERRRRMKRLFSNFKCDILDWHIPEDKITYLGGTNFESKCRYCGRPILWSSGGWFTCRRKKGGGE